MARPTTRPITKVLGLTPELGEQMREYPFEQRIESEDVPIRRLIEAGLKARRSAAKPKPARRKLMSIREETARQIVAALRKYLDQATLEKIMDDVMEMRGDKEFRDAVNLFFRLIRTG